MWSDLILCIILIMISLPFFLIPHLRKKTDSFITALKSVPLGCAVILVALVILNALFLFLTGLPDFMLIQKVKFLFFLFMIHTAFAAGCLFLIFLASRFWKPSFPGAKLSVIPFLWIFFALACFGVIYYPVVNLWQYARNPADYRSVWRVAPIPVKGEVGVTFEQRSIHPFLAEYEYRIRFRKGKETTFRYLKLNTGGRTAFNIYQLDNGPLLFKDKDGSYLVNPSERTAYLLFPHGKQIVPFLLPVEPFNGFGYFTSSTDQRLDFDFHLENGKTVKANAAAVNPVTENSGGMKYYGCIQSRFYPASERGPLLIR